MENKPYSNGWNIGVPLFSDTSKSKVFYGSRLVSFSDPLAAQVPNGKNDASDAQKATNSAWWMVKAPSPSFFSAGLWLQPQKVAENKR